MRFRDYNYIKTDDDKYPPKEFCKKVSCTHYNYIARIELHESIGIVDKKKTLGSITEERQEFCKKCLATLAFQFKKTKSSLS